jgi:hypothetical protein
MNDFQRTQRLREWVTNVLLAAVFADPENPWLTLEELREAARPEGFGSAEVHQLARALSTNDGRHFQSLATSVFTGILMFDEQWEDDPRDRATFQFVWDQFTALIREHGLPRTSIPQSVLLERARTSGLIREQAHVAIAALIIQESLVLEDGVLRCVKPLMASPRDQLSGGISRNTGRRYPVTAALAPIRDLVARRGDGRPLSTNPIQAFGPVFTRLVGETRRIWWEQEVNELLTLNPQTHPTKILVGAASLIEGAFSALVGTARKLTGGTAFAGRDYDKPARSWKLEDLLKAAKHPSAMILDEKLYQAADRLNTDRQRIHFARFLMDDNVIRLDIKPHEAEDAINLTKRVLAAIMEWLSAREPW